MHIEEVIRSDRPDFSGISLNYYLLGLRRAFESCLQAMADKAMQEISWKQFLAIICITLCREPPTLRELSGILDCSHQNVKQILLQLEKKFIEFVVDKKDRRKQRVVLTDTCRDFCERNKKRLRHHGCDVQRHLARRAVPDHTDPHENRKQSERIEPMKGMILYQSRYGATRRYAGWLAETTGFACIETTRAKIGDIMQYDTILLGGGIYASGMAGLSFLRKRIGQLQGRKIPVFCDGASPYEESVFQQLYSHNMKGPLAGLPLFCCRGSWDMERMCFRDRTQCRLLQKTVAKRNLPGGRVGNVP